jgi:hypothetical protein
MSAGDHLCAMLVERGKPETAETLCREIASRAPQARWAHRRLGYLLAAAERYEEGVAAFQMALKTDVADASESASNGDDSYCWQPPSPHLGMPGLHTAFASLWQLPGRAWHPATKAWAASPRRSRRTHEPSSCSQAASTLVSRLVG